MPAKVSKSSWKSFREVGTEFMRKKNDFYKEQKQAFNQNIDAKKDLINQSKEVLESEDWQAFVQKMKDIQKKWKSVGFVPRKIDNKLWKTFSEIQKEYFDRLKSGFKKLSKEQEALLKEKTAYLEKAKSHKFTADADLLKKESLDLWKAWIQLGVLDFRNESKLNQLFSKVLISNIRKVDLERKVLKEAVDLLNIKILENDPESLEKEYQTARNNLSNLKAELTQLENNLEFFSNSSSENPLFKNVEKQINSCQKKIDEAQEQYILLKQIKNLQNKLILEEEMTKNSTESQEEVSSEEV